MKSLILLLGLLSLIIAPGCEQSGGEYSGTRDVPPATGPKDLKNSRDSAKPEPAPKEVKISDQPVFGQLMGRSFQPEVIEYSEMGSLDFWVGDRFFPEAKVSILLGLGYGATPESRSFSMPGPGGGFRPSVRIELKSDAGAPSIKTYREGCRLELKLGQAVDQVIVGGIYLAVPEAGTELNGVFQLAAPEDPARQPENRHRPYVYGRIDFSPPEKGMLSAVYAGMGLDGQVYNNGAGLLMTRDGGPAGSHVQVTTYKPRTTTVWCDDRGILYYRHVRLTPGLYLLAFRWKDHLAAHRWQRVERDSSLDWSPEIRIEASGSLLIEAPGLKEYERIWLLPLDPNVELPEKIDRDVLWRLPFHLMISPEYKETSALYRFLPPGDYLVIYNEQRRKVTVDSGRRARVVLE